MGKIALSFSEPGELRLAEAVPALRIRPEASYLVTGGLGGLGLEVARWLVREGARHVVLLGRSAPSEAVRSRLRELEASGATLQVEQGDVASPEDVARVLGALPPQRPLRGVLHAAGVLDDGILLNQDWKRFAAVLAPKVSGAWNLHQATRAQGLDFFVLFSSGVSLLGLAGQGNYAAANAFLDALAWLRRAQGLSALSINWGAFSEVGMATRGPAAERLEQLGLGTLTPAQGLEALAKLLREGRTQAAVLPTRWARLAESYPEGPPPFLAELLSARTATPAPRPQSSLLRARLQEAPPEARRALLREHVRAQVAKVLALEPSSVNTARPLMEAGLDSLLAIELRTTLQAHVGDAATLPTMLIFRYPTVDDIAAFLAREVFHLEEPAPSPAPPKAQDTTEAAVASLSQRQAEAELAAELAALEAEGLLDEED
jgi:NAD(P)-dependent dehydrogenase (short-subunit alcohol dehydrogenase family)